MINDDTLKFLNKVITSIKKSKEDNEENKEAIRMLSEVETKLIIDKMNEFNGLQTKLSKIEESIDLILSNQKSIEEMLLNTATNVEEIMHCLEQTGILPGYEEIEHNENVNFYIDLLNKDETQQQYKKDDIMIKENIVKFNKKSELN